jgi:hypothetical protein
MAQARSASPNARYYNLARVERCESGGNNGQPTEPPFWCTIHVLQQVLGRVESCKGEKNVHVVAEEVT